MHRRPARERLRSGGWVRRQLGTRDRPGSLDADVVASLESEHVDALIAQLAAAYYIPVERLRSAVATRSSFNLIHLATMFKIDVFVSKRRPFDREATARARAQAIDEGPDAARFPIASPEDTVLAKLEWFRLGGDTSERQWWETPEPHDQNCRIARRSAWQILRTRVPSRPEFQGNHGGTLLAQPTDRRSPLRRW